MTPTLPHPPPPFNYLLWHERRRVAANVGSWRKTLATELWLMQAAASGEMMRYRCG
jgi:hypothetical protein